MEHDVIVIGAGISGLALARALSEAGQRVLTLDKARGVGGRCATRRLEETRLDHGSPLIHGRSPELRRLLDTLPAEQVLPDWPLHVRGEGTPCQPQAYDSRSRRLALGSGVSALAKALAGDRQVALQTRVERLERRGGAFVAHAGEQRFTARTLVLTCPVPQTLELLATLGDQGEALAAIQGALKSVFMLPCLTVMAGYHRAPAEDWHLWTPGSEHPIHTLVNDSSKRPGATRQWLVIQAQPRYSREHIDGSAETWRDELLAHTADLLGEWAARPAVCQTHAWRYARVQRGHELARPALLRWDDGALLGLCGDAFDPAGGVEGAYLSGLNLARRLTL